MNPQPLESFIFEKMSATRFPGISIAIVKGDDLLYARGFGFANLEKAAAATPDTIYGAASITKSFTALAILQLAEKGLLSVEDPVDKHLPFPIKIPNGPLRIKHLLSHTQGIPALGYVEALLGHYNDVGGSYLPIASPKDIPAFMTGAEPWIHCPPGERWFYFNEGYVLLGEIIAKLSGKTFEQYMREHVFTPLGMSRSMFAQEDLNAAGNAAVPYVMPADAPPRPGKYAFNVMGGDANLLTSAVDLAKYLSMFLRKGKPLLSEASYQEMTKPRIATPAKPVPSLFGDDTDPGEFSYCYALGHRTFFGQPMLGHAGMVLSSTGHIAFLPKSGLGVAVLGNSNAYPMFSIAQVALALALGKDHTTLPFLKIEAAYKKLEGRYESYKATVTANIKREGDFLRFQFTHRKPLPGWSTFVPERIDGPNPRFFTYEGGNRTYIEFKVTGNDVEVINERYKLKRTGPLPK